MKPRRIRDDVDDAEQPRILQKTQDSLLPLTTARPNDPNYNKVSAEIQRMTESVVSGEASPGGRDGAVQGRSDRHRRRREHRQL